MPRHAAFATAIPGGRTGVGISRCSIGRTRSNESARHRGLDGRNREATAAAGAALALTKTSNSYSADDGGLYNGGVSLGATTGDGVADEAMSLAFASSSSFFSSG